MSYATSCIRLHANSRKLRSDINSRFGVRLKQQDVSNLKQSLHGKLPTASLGTTEG